MTSISNMKFSLIMRNKLFFFLVTKILLWSSLLQYFKDNAWVTGRVIELAGTSCNLKIKIITNIIMVKYYPLPFHRVPGTAAALVAAHRAHSPLPVSSILPVTWTPSPATSLLQPVPWMPPAVGGAHSHLPLYDNQWAHRRPFHSTASISTSNKPRPISCDIFSGSTPIYLTFYLIIGAMSRYRATRSSPWWLTPSMQDISTDWLYELRRRCSPLKTLSLVWRNPRQVGT